MQAGQTSFWEQDAMLSADFIVVGGGLIGLQTALELRERRPHARIMVLERGVLPAGASSRNAGFACFGSLTEILEDFDTLGVDAALNVIEQRWRGLDRLRRRLGDEAIGYEALGGNELLFELHLVALDRLDEVNGHLQALFGRTVFSTDEPALRSCGFGPQARMLIRNPLEGQLHSGRLMRALAVLARQQGIELYTGAAVAAWEEGGGEVRLQVQPLLPHACSVEFRAARVAFCTNGFTLELIQDSGIVPARGQVLVTEPIAGLGWRGTFHVERGFYYFRNVGERVLLGGGRHHDFAGEASCDMVLTDGIQRALERLLQEVVLPGRRPRIEQRWAGIMGFSRDKKPQVRLLSERVALGFGCNGMGVALGADVAAQTAELLA